MRKRLAAILETVERLTRGLSFPLTPSAMEPFQISTIASKTGILPNNASSDLNELFLSGHLFKVKGRPVYYLSLPALEQTLGIVLPSNQASSLEAFQALLRSDAPPAATGSSAPSQLNAAAPSGLDELIGARESLRSQIRQAKAAILYPQNGLHTLITGQTGTGKSSFARCMHDFAVKSGKLGPSAPFITLNCANYADNPQLLLSQLFGHVRGAFTGADKEHTGLVEHANNGILFFDEVHRLSAEGQEKLFLLMDRGVYSRLGETGKERRAKVLILGATTEAPDATLLSTFLRRIPVHIALPPLQERDLRERVQLVFYFLWQEARSMKMRISVAQELLFSFCYYSCAANIGQLSMDVKLTCASAYYDYLLGQNRSMLIQIPHLASSVREGLYTSSNSRNSLLTSLLRPETQGPITFDGSQSHRELLAKYTLLTEG